MAAEGATQTSGVGSATREYVDVSKEKQSSKDDVRQERGGNAEPHLSKYEQEQSQNFAMAGEPQAKTCQIVAWRSASQEKEASHRFTKKLHRSKMWSKRQRFFILQMQAMLTTILSKWKRTCIVLPLTLEDELERKRSHWDDVPPHIKRTRKRTLPQLREQPAGADNLPYLAVGAVDRRRCIADSHMCGSSAGTPGKKAEDTRWGNDASLIGVTFTKIGVAGSQFAMRRWVGGGRRGWWWF